jgi:soluble lytic murein transglycosylase-like protein
MNRSTLFWVAGGIGLIYLISRTQTAQNIATSGEDIVTATLSGWKSVEQGPYWVPILNSIEQANNLPADLLARIAYQESRFRQTIIEGPNPDPIVGTNVSSAGALGLMQLMPQYFTTVQRPTPFSQQDTLDQANQAAQLLANLYAHYGDWGLAVMAYNDGQGNIDAYVAGTKALPQQTINYFNQVTADVPIATNVQLA